MGIVKNFLNKAKSKQVINTLNFHEFFKKDEHINDLNEVTYYTCLKVLSESLGKLSIHLKDKDNKKVTDHEALQILRYKPNIYMNCNTLKTLWEYSRNHYGNSFSYLHRDRDGKLLGIYPLDNTKIKVLVDNAGLTGQGLLYEYTDENSKVWYLRAGDVLHFKGGLSKTGIVGQSVRETLAISLDGVKNSTKYLNNLYKRGLTAKGLLRYTGDLNSTNQTNLLKKVKKFLEDEEVNPMGILPMPVGLDLVPLDLKLTDSQFFELKKYTSLQIAGAFGIKPNHLNNYESSSYANSEMQNLTFYIDTLLYILTHYEEELNRKLLTSKELREGLHFEFNVASLLRGDLKTQAECIRTYVSSGVYSINEARKMAGLPATKGGDVIVINGSYVPLDKIGIAYEKKEV